MISQGPGGSALNTAWHLAAQGVRCSLHAAVGADRMGQMLRTALEAESKVEDAGKTLVALDHDATATCLAMFGPRVVGRGRCKLNPAVTALAFSS